MAAKIYAEVDGSAQQIGGDCPDGYLPVDSMRPDGFYKGVDNGDGTASWVHDAISEVYAARVAEYGSIQDQLDEIYHDIDSWRSRIASVKASHPKP